MKILSVEIHADIAEDQTKAAQDALTQAIAELTARLIREKIASDIQGVATHIEPKKMSAREGLFTDGS